jgi:glycosyltransferase involved in cell wall biosynthesis
LISVVTPSYNRAHTLIRLFESLEMQGGVPLEWVVVDDGSTDATASLLSDLQRHAAFPVRVYAQENSGRHVALNYGIREARGEFIMLMDSDDWLAVEGLPKLMRHWDAVPHEQKDSFAGVTGLCADMNGALIGSPFPDDVWDSDSLTMRAWAGVTGDKKELIRSDLLKKVPFPEVPGERRAPTSLALNRLSATHRVRFVNEVVAYKEYEPGGMSANIDSIRMRSPVTTRLSYLEVINANRALPVGFLLRNCINYLRYSLHARAGLAQSLRESGRPLLTAFALAPAGALFLRDRWRESKRPRRST